MSFSRKIKYLSLFIALMVSSPMAAVGKIRFAIGDERKIINPKGKETEAKTGGKVREKDKIRTGIEAQVIVAFPDGSIVSVEENSLIEFGNLKTENGVQTAMTDVKQGKVRFNAQSQKGNSKFQFKTGTATAAIRGTDGLIGISKKRHSIFGLNSGKMDISDDCGASTSIGAGEMAILSSVNCKLQKFQTKHAGDNKIVDEILNMLDNDDGKIDETKIKGLLEIIENTIENIKKEKENNLKCTPTALEDTISTNSIVVETQCAATPQKIYVNEILASENSNNLKLTIDWDPNSLGEKKFEFTCIDNIDVVSEAKKLNIPEKSIPESMKNIPLKINCGNVHTYYYNAKIDSLLKANIEKMKQDSINNENFELNINANYSELCEKGTITLNGQIRNGKRDSTKNISFLMNVGNSQKTFSIPSTEIEFTQIISIKDAYDNWNASSIEVTATFPNNSTKKISIPIAINKACKSVNTKSPIVKIISNNSTKKCEAKYEISSNEDDMGLASVYKDNDLFKEFTFKNNESGSFKLYSGKHTYKIVITDQSGNIGSDSKLIPCYTSNKSAYISINGKKNHFVDSKRVPNAPPNFKTNLRKTMKVKIHNIDNNDFSQIESIIVTEEGKNNHIYFVNNANNSIDSFEFDVPVEVEYGKRTTFKVKVKLYNGKILENSRTYYFNSYVKEAR